jgi:NDP-sugar pyrophosphorylase family protein
MSEHGLDKLDVLILVGGLGTRLRSVLRSDVPKPLAPIAGRPFLFYLLQFLARQGVKRVILAIGFLGQLFEVSLKMGMPAGMEIAFSKESEPLGTAGAIRKARPLLTTDPVLVLNGDSICLAALAPMLTSHRQKNAKTSILLVWINDRRSFGSVQIGPNEQIIKFGEKNAAGGPGLINAGIYLLSQRALGELPDKVPCSLEYEVFPRWIGSGLYGVSTEAPFLDIGTPSSYATAEQFFGDWSG